MQFLFCPFSHLRLGIKCSIVLIPLLGITWVFGVLAFDQATVVFLYLFAILNSLQVCLFQIFWYRLLFQKHAFTRHFLWSAGLLATNSGYWLISICWVRKLTLFFTYLNLSFLLPLQGLFIFVFHCIFDQQVCDFIFGFT